MLRARLGSWWITGIGLAAGLVLGGWDVGRAASLTGLGTIGDTEVCVPTAVSPDGGTAAGTCISTAHRRVPAVFSWTQPGGLKRLGTLPSGAKALSANAVGPEGKVIVGSSEDLGKGSEGFVWTPETGMVGLGGPHGISSVPSAVASGNGLIVGISETTGGIKPFRWTPQSGLQPLPNMPPRLRAEVYGVSSDGSVLVGRAWLTGIERTRGWAYRWTETDGFMNLEPPRGDDYYVGSTATALSADGRVVVGDSVFNGTRQAFRWTKESGMVALGTLPGETYSEARALSGDGLVVVGQSGSRPFIWDQRRGLRDLQKVLESDYGLSEGLGGWKLTAVNAMSADGLVLVGEGVNPSGKPEGWVLNLRARSAR